MIAQAEDNASFRRKADHVIVSCPLCHQKLRLPGSVAGQIEIRCGKCQHKFMFRAQLRGPGRSLVDYAFLGALAVLPLVMLALPFLLRIDSNGLNSEYDEAYSLADQSFEEELRLLNAANVTALAAIRPDEIANDAFSRYDRMWRERQDYNPKHALTPRERSLLKMRQLARSGNPAIRDLIQSIAVEAAPHGATVVVLPKGNLYDLKIDFDMSSLTSGERGSRTKHKTVPSLKREVVALVSRVTYDVAQMCHEMKLDTVLIGCKHGVIIRQTDGREKVQDEVIYRISLQTHDLSDLSANPFLGTYSTKNHFRVEIDEFSSLTIVNSAPSTDR